MPHERAGAGVRRGIGVGPEAVSCRWRSDRGWRSGGGRCEAEPGLGRPGQTPEELVGGLDHRPAGLADEVGVGERGELVGGRAVPEVGVDDHAEVLEVLEVAVDGREVDVGGALPGPLRPAPRRSGGPRPRRGPPTGCAGRRWPGPRGRGRGSSTSSTEETSAPRRAAAICGACPTVRSLQADSCQPTCTCVNLRIWVHAAS